MRRIWWYFAVSVAGCSHSLQGCNSTETHLKRSDTKKNYWSQRQLSIVYSLHHSYCLWGVICLLAVSCATAACLSHIDALRLSAPAAVAHCSETTRKECVQKVACKHLIERTPCERWVCESYVPVGDPYRANWLIAYINVIGGGAQTLPPKVLPSILIKTTNTLIQCT